MKKLECRIRFARGHSSVDGDYCAVEILDDLSGCVAVEVRLRSLDDAARCFLHNQEVKADMDFNDSGVIGMKHEHKTEEVPIPKYLPSGKSAQKQRDAMIDKALEPFEVDGWKGSRRDCVNQHCRVGSTNLYRVTFHRHVPVDEASKSA